MARIARARIFRETMLLRAGGGIFLFLLTAVPALAAPQAPVLNQPTSECTNPDAYVSLTWSRSAGAAFYDIYRDGGALRIGTVPDSDPPLFLDPDVAPRQRRTYTVRARDIAGASSPDSIARAITVERCGAELSLTGARCEATGAVVDLSWTNFPDAIRTNVFRNGSELLATLPAGQNTLLGQTATSTEAADYMVQSVWNDGGTIVAKYSDSLLNVTPPACDPTLSGSKDCNAPGPQALLQWTAMRGAEEYQIFRDGLFDHSTGVRNSEPDKNVSQNTTYRYRVKALYPNGSADSNELPIEVPRCPPRLTAQNTCNPSNPAISEVLLSWTLTEGAANYNLNEILTKNIFVKQCPHQDGTCPIVNETISFKDADVLSGQNYTYQVEARVPGQPYLSNATQVAANCAIEPKPLPAPKLSVIPQCTGGRSEMALSWTPSNNVVLYAIERTNNRTGVTEPLGNRASDQLDFPDQVEVATSYTYRVIARGNGDSTPSNSFTETSVNCTAPSMPLLNDPTKFCAAANQPAVNLSWNRTSNTEKYEIVRDGLKISEILDPTQTSDRDRTGKNLTTYQYQIRAVGPDGAGSTLSAPPKFITTPNCAPPGTPVLSVRAPAGGICSVDKVDVTLDWTRSPNATSYTLFRKLPTDAAFRFVANFGAGTRTHPDRGLPQGAQIFYYVDANGAPGLLPATSDQIEVRTRWCAPTAPAISSVTPQCTGNIPEIKVTWDPNTINTIRYNVRRTDGTPVGSVNFPGGERTDSPVVTGVTYQYIVQAEGPGGDKRDSLPSTPVDGPSCLIPNPPRNLSTTATCSGSNPGMRIRWDATQNTISYDVFRLDGANPPIPLGNVLYDRAIARYEFIDPGPLVAEANYTWRVIAKGPQGVAPVSADVAGRTGSCIPSQPVITTFRLQCTADNKSVIYLFWTDATPSNTLYYRIERVGRGEVGRVSPPQTDFIDTNNDLGFPPGEEHRYEVIAVGKNNTGETSSVRTPRIRTADCRAPSQPVVERIEQKCDADNRIQVELQWAASQNAIQYDVLDVVQNNRVVATLDEIGQPSYTKLLTTTEGVREATPSSYRYVVRARNAIGPTDSLPTRIDTDYCPPNQPIWSGLPVPSCQGGDSRMRLDWTSNPPIQNVRRFEIWRNDGTGFNLAGTANAQNGAGTFLDDNNNRGLPENVDVMYKIVGVGPTGKRSIDSPERTRKTNICPAPPVLLPPSISAVSTCTNQFNPITLVRWSADPIATEYRVAKNGIDVDVVRHDPDTMLKSWLILGPFPDPNRNQFDTDFIGEQRVRPRQDENGGGKFWETFLDRTYMPGDYLNISGYWSRVGINTTNTITYLFTYVESLDAMDAELRIGSDDGVKAWLNGIEVLRDAGPHAARFDDQKKFISLSRGINTLLLKVRNFGGVSGVYPRITDTNGTAIPSFIISADSLVGNGGLEARYKVTATDGLQTVQSIEIKETPPRCAPTDPSPLIALPQCDASSNSTIQLTWTPTENTNHYAIWWWSDTDPPTFLGPTPTEPRYTVESIQKGKKYYFQIEAVGGPGKSEWSNSAEVTASPCNNIPDKPDLTAGNITTVCEGGRDSRILVKWPPVDSISYQVYRSQNGVNYVPIQPTVNNNDNIVDGKVLFINGGNDVIEGRRYWYYVQAIGSGATPSPDSDHQGPITAKICSGPPAPPTLNDPTKLLNVYDIAAGTMGIRLTWRDVSDNTETLRLARCVAANENTTCNPVFAAKRPLLANLSGSIPKLLAELRGPVFRILDDGDPGFYEDMGTEKTCYAYDLEAANTAGSTNSGTSKTVCLPILPPGPFTLNAVPRRDCSSVTLDWAPGAEFSPAGGPVTYRADWSPPNENDFQPLGPRCNGNLGVTTCETVPPLRTRVTYRITAQNRGGETSATKTAACAENPRYCEINPTAPECQ